MLILSSLHFSKSYEILNSIAVRIQCSRINIYIQRQQKVMIPECPYGSKYKAIKLQIRHAMVKYSCEQHKTLRCNQGTIQVNVNTG